MVQESRTMHTRSTIQTVFIYPFRYCNNQRCSKLIKPRPGEPLSKFLRRNHCDDACARDNPLRRRAQSEAFRKRRESVPKRTCVVCEEEFDRGKTESISNYKKREICGRVCAAEKRTKEKEADIAAHPKTCVSPLCGKTFYRRFDGETKPRFEARETCSPYCGHIKRRHDPHKLVKETKKGRSTGGKKKKVEEKHKLPEVSPLPIEIPPPPTPVVTEIEVWRPASWGGPYKRRVS